MWVALPADADVEDELSYIQQALGNQHRVRPRGHHAPTVADDVYDSVLPADATHTPLSDADEDAPSAVEVEGIPEDKDDLSVAGMICNNNKNGWSVFIVFLFLGITNYGLCIKHLKPSYF